MDEKNIVLLQKNTNMIKETNHDIHIFKFFAILGQYSPYDGYPFNYFFLSERDKQAPSIQKPT